MSNSDPPRSEISASKPPLANDRSSLWTAVGLGLGVAIGNGFGRFSYALILPSMRTDLHWTYAQAGLMNTANSLGYILGAISGYWLLRRVTPTRLFIFGIIATDATLPLTGIFRDISWLFIFRILSGIGAAWIFSCGAALVTIRFQDHPESRGAATGIYFAGGGLGIAVSGLCINPILSQFGYRFWPFAWIALGALSILATTWPVVEALGTGSSMSAAANGVFDLRLMRSSFIAYFLFAAGYIVYMTFIFAWIQSAQHSTIFGTVVWAVLGTAVVASPFIWRRALGSWNPSLTLAASSALTFCGAVIPVMTATSVGIVVSAALFGLGLFIAPSAVTVLTRKVMPSDQWAKTITIYTIVFSLGQAIGPVFAGAIADRTSLTMSLLFGAILLCASAGVAAFRHERLAVRY